MIKINVNSWYHRLSNWLRRHHPAEVFSLEFQYYFESGKPRSICPYSWQYIVWRPIWFLVHWFGWITFHILVAGVFLVVLALPATLVFVALGTYHDFFIADNASAWYVYLIVWVPSFIFTVFGLMTWWISIHFISTKLNIGNFPSPDTWIDAKIAQFQKHRAERQGISFIGMVWEIIKAIKNRVCPLVEYIDDKTDTSID